jgi:hypothetical protein
MAYIISYQKNITRYITVQVNAPDGANELCTVGGTTYVSVPGNLDLSASQPDLIKESINRVEVNAEFLELMEEHCTHIWLINSRLKQKIGSLDKGDKSYDKKVSACESWAYVEKLGLGLVGSNYETPQPATGE